MRLFPLSTQAQDHVWDLAKYNRVEPAHCPTGATSGGTCCERNLLWAYHPLCLRTRLVLCMTGVFELDLTRQLVTPHLFVASRFHAFPLELRYAKKKNPKSDFNCCLLHYSLLQAAAQQSRAVLSFANTQKLDASAIACMAFDKAHYGAVIAQRTNLRAAGKTLFFYFYFFGGDVELAVE
jgi:hypothetical protein